MSEWVKISDAGMYGLCNGAFYITYGSLQPEEEDYCSAHEVQPLSMFMDHHGVDKMERMTNDEKDARVLVYLLGDRNGKE